MKIEVYPDEWYIDFAYRVKGPVQRWHSVIEVPDEWAERYFAAREEFTKLSLELGAHIDSDGATK